MINRLKSWFDIKKVYVLIFATLAFWSIFAYGTMSQLIKSQEVYAKLINISGKQRMLSQKTTLFAKRYFESKNLDIKTHLKDLIDLMKKDHDFMISSLSSKKTKDIYFSDKFFLDKKVKAYFVLLDKFYTNPNISVLKAIEEYSFKLLPQLNHAVNTFENESNEKTADLKHRQFLILLGTLITLLLEALFIVIPSIRYAQNKEKELEELNRSLQEKIDYEIDLVRKKDQMILHQAKMASLGEMLENIAHQWRQPLSVITTSATGIKLKQEYNLLEKEDLEKFIDKIVSSSNFLSDTIDDFRSFFTKDKVIEEFDIKNVYNKSIQLVSSKLKNRNIILLDEIDDIKLFGYENELVQVLLNLFSNAKDILEKVDQEDRYIFTKIYEYTDDKVIIEIQDSGGGVADDIIEKIFEPYFTTKHQSQGTGIGLFMSSEMVVKHMDGSIAVENRNFTVKDKEYFGAVFSITLPKKIDKVISKD